MHSHKFSSIWCIASAVTVLSRRMQLTYNLSHRMLFCVNICQSLTVLLLGEEVTDQWYSEVSKYDFKSPGFKQGNITVEFLILSL